MPVACARNASAPGAADSIEYVDADSSDMSVSEPEPEPEPESLVFESPEALKEWIRNSEFSNEYSAGIIPMIADASLDYATRLINDTHKGFIVVDKSRMKVLLFDHYGRQEKSYGMACAKNFGTKHKKADSRTPEGFFSVEGVYNSEDWLFTDDDGVTSPKKGQFGPRFIRLKIPTTSQIGIHGTCAPWSIGGRSSHGCIRIKNENILELVELVEKGMPVIVVPGRKDVIVNEEEGYDIPWIPTSPTAKDPRKNLPKKTKDTAEAAPQEPSDTVGELIDSASMPSIPADSAINESPDTITVSDKTDTPD